MLLILKISPVVKLWQWGMTGPQPEEKGDLLNTPWFAWYSLGPYIYSSYCSGNGLCTYNLTARFLGWITWLLWFSCLGASLLLWNVYGNPLWHLDLYMCKSGNARSLTLQILPNGRPKPRDKYSCLHPLCKQIEAHSAWLLRGSSACLSPRYHSFNLYNNPRK